MNLSLLKKEEKKIKYKNLYRDEYNNSETKLN